MLDKKVSLLILFSAVYLWIAALDGVLGTSSSNPSPSDWGDICVAIELEKEVDQVHFLDVMLFGFGTPILETEPIFIAFSNDFPVATPRTREASPFLLRGPPTSQS